MKLIGHIIFLLVINFTYCQDNLNINYDEIKTLIQDSESEYYYPKLLKRFNDFDPTLTDYENALIYYGFSFHENYLKNKLSEVNLKKFIEANDFENLEKECIKILDKNPLSLEANNNLGFALYNLGKPEEEWKKYQKRYRNIRKVIALSGNGKSCDSAFKVIYVSDEYNMMNSYFELVNIKRQGIQGLCDYFKTEQSKYYNNTEIYFDASRSLIRHQEIIDKD
jgi:tetratricopeptide (TPR) repeat protein